MNRRRAIKRSRAKWKPGTRAVLTIARVMRDLNRVAADFAFFREVSEQYDRNARALKLYGDQFPRTPPS